MGMTIAVTAEKLPAPKPAISPVWRVEKIKVA